MSDTCPKCFGEMEDLREELAAAQSQVRVLESTATEFQAAVLSQRDAAVSALSTAQERIAKLELAGAELVEQLDSDWTDGIGHPIHSLKALNEFRRALSDKESGT